MAERTTHRTYCRICVAVCGLEVDVEDGCAVAVRGDEAHPLSAGYSCNKGRALPALHHNPDRLDTPLVRVDGQLAATTWPDVLADLDGRLSDLVDESGPGSIGFFTGSGMYLDTAGYWATRRLMRRFASGHFYSDTTIDSAAKYRVMELMAGTYSLMAHADPQAKLVVMFGTNPVVSHGQTPMFEDPVQRLRRSKQQGEVWVIDPRRTESARLASRHLAIRAGTDHAVLGFLVRSLLDDGVDREELERRASQVDELVSAVAPFTLQATAALTSLPDTDLVDLLAAVRRAGRLAVLTGTGVTMSPAGNIAEWLAWALLAVTDSFDQPGGMWFNPGFLARLDQRASIPSSGPPGVGPPTRPDIPTLMGEWPAAVIPAEIEGGNLRALFVLGGNIVTALPDTNRLLAALPQLDVLAVVDVARNATTPYATHVLPAHAQLERPDVPLLNDLFNSKLMVQYTRAVLEQHPGRRSAWWILAHIGRLLGVDVLPSAMDMDTVTDDEVLDLVVGSGVVDRLRDADPPWLEAPTPAPGWLAGKLPSATWNLAPLPLVAQLATLDASPALVLTPRRQPRRFNGRMIREGDRAEVLLHPDDAAQAGVVDGELVDVSSSAGSLPVQARVTDTISAGSASISHGRAECNVNVLVSSRLLDPLTGMPRQSGTAVEIRPAAAGSETDASAGEPSEVPPTASLG
jgi:anaerobic selenocysteine-containing dehydrogenase